MDATFTVRLPLLGSHKVDEIVRLRVVETPAAEAIRLDGIRLLLAEDDADAQHVLTFILELAGANLEAVVSVGEALSAFEDFRPDVLVSAVGLADEDGYALIRRVLAREIDRGGKTPAIALTGYVTPEDRARLLEAGFQLHVRKPVEPSEIAAAIASLTVRGSR